MVQIHAPQPLLRRRIIGSTFGLGPNSPSSNLGVAALTALFKRERFFIRKDVAKNH